MLLSLWVPQPMPAASPHRRGRFFGAGFAALGALGIGGLLGGLDTAFWITPAFEVGAGVLFALALIPLRRAKGTTYPQLLLASVVGPLILYAAQVAVTAALEGELALTKTDGLFLAAEWLITVVATRYTLRHSHDEVTDEV